MKEISVFDVIGPNMIGPSSSHTAGALRIALVAKKLVGDDIKQVTFVLYGSFAKTYKGHGTDRALVAGMLGMNTEDERIKNAFVYAKQQGLNYRFETDDTELEYHPNIVDIIVTHGDGTTTSVMGASTGGGNIKIVNRNGIEIEFSGNYYTMIVRQHDVKGVVAYITQCLSECDINIAFMRLYREAKGETAYTIIEADQKINESVISLIEKSENIVDVKLVEGL